MRAVRKLAPGRGNVEVVDAPEPQVRPGHVVIAVEAAGICGTDVHIVDDEFATEPPVTLGHELAGTLVDVGRDVQSWQVGDRVTSETYFSTCGRCAHCRRGRPNLCSERKSIGSKRDGAFASHVLVPATNLHRVPDGLDLESAALTEPLACAVHGVIDTAGAKAGDWVAITGPGPIGLLTLQLVLAAGARAVVIGTAQDRDRLALAADLGADATLEGGDVDDPAAWFADTTGADGADLVVECSGAGPAVDTLLKVVAKGGRYAQMGLFGRGVTLDQDVVCYKELAVTGTNASVPSAWPRALALLASGQVDASRLVSHRFDVEAWDEALRTVRSKVGVKVVLKP